MRLLSALILAIFGFALIISVTIVGGRARPASPGLTMLHLDMCAPPCWIGIIPDVTTLQDANRLIAQIYPPSRYKILPCGCTIQDLQDPNLKFTVLLDADDKSIVDDIDIYLSNILIDDQWTPVDKPPISWADLNSLWGSPYDIAVTPRVGTWLPQYQESQTADVVIAASEGFPDANSHMSWTSPVESVELSPPYRGFVLQRQWRGFLTYRQYNYRDCGFDINLEGTC